MQRSKVPQFINDDVFTKYREGLYEGFNKAGLPRRDNIKDEVEKMRAYSTIYKDTIPRFGKKEKTQKIGKLGMDELTKIVLELNQDVKQIREAQSLEGAQRWVNRNGPDLYTASIEDPNNDGIPDVIVKNNLGKNVIVNGYTTDSSTYPYRFKYYTQYPTVNDRKEARQNGDTFREYINGLYNPQYDDFGIKIQTDEDGNPAYGNQAGLELERQMAKSGYNKIIKPHNRTPFQAFCKLVLKPIYDVIRYLNGIYNVTTNPELFMKVATDIWNQAVLLPAMNYVYPPTEDFDVTQLDEKTWKKLRNKKQVKAAITDFVQIYTAQPRAMIDFVPIFVKGCKEYGNPIDENIEPWIPEILKCRLLNMDPPNFDDENAWAKIDQEFHKRFIGLPINGDDAFL